MTNNNDPRAVSRGQITSRGEGPAAEPADLAAELGSGAPATIGGIPIASAILLPADHLDAESAWNQHIPFAFWLIQAHAPSIFVELGTFRGTSYFSFCQAVAALRLPTRCFAVDTWQGDSHTGFYDESVFARVNASNELKYAGFSRLVRSTFDEAVPHFLDGSIDLLHIDGLHTYEACRHDFESWLPKLSRRAIVLFHDTNVRERGFGVHRLWAELVERYPHFEFVHEHGLGVLGVGEAFDAPVRELFAAADDGALTSELRSAFWRLASAVRTGMDLKASGAERARLETRLSAASGEHEIEVSRLAAESARLRLALDEKERQAAQLMAQCAAACSDKAELGTALAAARSRNAGLDAALAAARSASGELDAALAAARSENAELNAALAKARQEGADRQAALDEKVTELATVRDQAAHTEVASAAAWKELDAIRRSTSWQVAQLLRQIAARSRFARHAARMVKGVRWTKSLGARLHAYFVLRANIRLIATSGLFDHDWYLERNADVRAAGVSPLLHYLRHGAFEGRDPNPFFDSDWYLQRNPDVRAAGANPLVHYLQKGAVEGRNPSVLFDGDRYLDHNPDVRAAGVNPLAHYLRHAPADARDPDRSRALPPERGGISRHAAESIDARKTLLAQSAFFDDKWYLNTYRDVARANADPLSHFIQYGRTELRSPGPNFDARWYVNEYPEAVSNGFDPLTHYINIGQHKGFKPFGPYYPTWCKRFDILEDQDVVLIRDDIASNDLPSLNIVILVDNSTENFLDATIAAIEQQIFTDWQALIAIDNSCNSGTIEKAQLAARTNSQICVFSQQRAVSNISRSASSAGVVVMHSGIVLREHALYMFSRAAKTITGAGGIVYADEDGLDADGYRRNPIFKPTYSPVLAQQLNYFGRCVLGVDRNRAIFGTIEQWGSGVGTIDRWVQEIVNCTESEDIIHIPFILFHNMIPPQTYVSDHVMSLLSEDLLPTFSIIIPTRDRIDLLRPCVTSIETRSDYPKTKLELVIVDNGSTDGETIQYLTELCEQGRGRGRVVRDAGKFNFSRLNNLAAASAQNEVLLFVNNDTVVHDPLWLRRVATFVIQKDIAAVGGRLLYPDRTIQHGGVILGIQGVAGHNLVGQEEGSPKARADATRELSAVTGACLAMRREVFEEVGGFDTAAAMAFNDVLLCLDALKAGYRNIYINQPLMIHFESRSRGYNDTPEKLEVFQREACYARRRHGEAFRYDRYYNPNLSLHEPYELAFPPRRAKPWRVWRRNVAKLRILFLSSTHELGHGVPVVLRLQAGHLIGCGHEVFVGGPRGRSEVPYEGCRRIFLTDPVEAASFAVQHGIDCIVVETPPFFSAVRWLGEWPRTLFVDHGEPPAELFPDADARRQVAAEKRLCFAMASQVAAISASVRAEGSEERAQIIPNGNSHLCIWHDSLLQQREVLRHKFGWTNKVVVLNVCRFRAAERRYKGLDKYAEVRHEFQFMRPKLAARTVFIVCGKAELDDVIEMRRYGFEVYGNITDIEMEEIYMAADIYVNFSQWEGYNLGIGQALAAGLPVVASDIAAHRAFPIFTSNGTLDIVEKLSEYAERVLANQVERKPLVIDWKPSLEKVEREIVELCR